MNTLIKIIVTSILALTLFSCNFSMKIGPGVDGNGNVVTTERSISSDFDQIKASEGLDVYITQANEVSVNVEADENLQDIILTEVENGVLRIHTAENIRSASSRRINLSIANISGITATSGSDVYSTNTIVAENLELNTTSGADMKIDVKTKNLSCDATSGSDLIVSGTTDILKAEATSGSDIKATGLIANTSNVKATSGADISVNTKKELTAKATSGGDIKYSGNPEKVNTSDSSSGSVKQQ